MGGKLPFTAYLSKNPKQVPVDFYPVPSKSETTADSSSPLCHYKYSTLFKETKESVGVCIHAISSEARPPSIDFSQLDETGLKTIKEHQRQYVADKPVPLVVDLRILYW